MTGHYPKYDRVEYTEKEKRYIPPREKYIMKQYKVEKIKLDARLKSLIFRCENNVEVTKSFNNDGDFCPFYVRTYCNCTFFSNEEMD